MLRGVLRGWVGAVRVSACLSIERQTHGSQSTCEHAPLERIGGAAMRAHALQCGYSAVVAVPTRPSLRTKHVLRQKVEEAPLFETKGGGDATF